MLNKKSLLAVAALVLSLASPAAQARHESFTPPVIICDPILVPQLPGGEGQEKPSPMSITVIASEESRASETQGFAIIRDLTPAAPGDSIFDQDPSALFGGEVHIHGSRGTFRSQTELGDVIVEATVGAGQSRVRLTEKDEKGVETVLFDGPATCTVPQYSSVGVHN